MDALKIEQELHIKDYINILYRRRAIATLFLVSTVLVVGIGSFIMKPVYRATATLLIDMESPNVLTTSGMVALESQNYYSYKEYYQSQQEIITSLSIVGKVFKELDPTVLKEYSKSKEPLKKLLGSIEVEPVRDTRLIRLHVDNEDPVLAARIANRMAEIYVQRNLYYISRGELTNLLKNEYLKLETKLSEYSKTYKAKHPQMIRVKDEIREIAEKIEQVKESSFDTDFFEKDTTEGKYKYALDVFKANNISIQDPAKVPVIPVKPSKRLNVLIALIVGLFGGAGLAFFFEYLDDTVKNVGDLERLVKWSFLGNVPDINNAGEMSEFEKDILVHKKPKDPIAEAYRAIRTSMLFLSTEEHPLRSVVVTSPGPQEGKTISLCNLGIALAQSDKKVLLVDADMRKPRLHTIFKKRNAKGLSSFLSGQAEFEGLIHDTKINNLSIISGGSCPPNPSELLSSHKMQEFIKTAIKSFDCVLLDSPPIALVTDAAILAKVADGVVVVIENGKTSKRALPRISQILEGSKVKVVGMLVNKVSPDSASGYSYSHRYYGETSQ